VYLSVAVEAHPGAIEGDLTFWSAAACQVVRTQRRLGRRPQQRPVHAPPPLTIGAAQVGEPERSRSRLVGLYPLDPRGRGAAEGRVARYRPGLLETERTGEELRAEQRRSEHRRRHPSSTALGAGRR